jgi:translation initiation factor IF-3
VSTAPSFRKDVIENPINRQIQSRQVRLLTQDKSAVVLTLEEALRRAEDQQVDLIQVAQSNDTIPVCRLERFDKFQYQKQKEAQRRQKDQRESAKRNEIKELQVRVEIDPHDLAIKIAHAKEFFAEGKRVKWVLKFRGREISHADRGQSVLEDIRTALATVAVATPLMKEGKVWHQVWAPKA